MCISVGAVINVRTLQKQMLFALTAVHMVRASVHAGDPAELRDAGHVPPL